MKALNNIGRISYANDSVMQLIRLYQYKGKEFYYHNILKNDASSMMKSTIAKDTFYMTKILGLNITENRLRLLINKDSLPRNNDERLVSNLKAIFEITYKKGHNFELKANSVLSLATRLYADIKLIRFDSRRVEVRDNLLVDVKDVSKRDLLTEILNKYQDLLSTEKYEILSLIVNFYIDFINLKPFKDDTEIIGLLLIFVLSIRERFDVSMYQSFFEFIYNNYAEFKQNVIAANYNYDSGFSHTEPLTNFLIRNLLDNYSHLELTIRNYEFDNKLNKSDNIENTINKAPNVFTKEDIRQKHPYVSDSTINRTLQRLRDEGKISPLGTGRSAKWVRVVTQPEHFNLYEQLDIFGFENED